MLVVHAAVPVDPDRREEALELAADLADQSRAEEGVLDYRATTDVNDPSVLRFQERYADEAAFEAHLDTDHYREFAAALPDLLAGQPEAHRFDVSEARELEL